MKILEIDYDYYQFPQGIATVEAFTLYLSNNYHSFIPMVQYQTENCFFPYLIREEIKIAYLNAAQISKVSEAEATVLCREDYEARHNSVVQQKCITCAHYEEDSEVKGHREKISFDGECVWYEKKAE